MLKVYVARSITGCSFEEVYKYYMSTCRRLKAAGAIVYHPMVGKDSLRTEKKLRSQGYDNNPITTNRAISERDLWMIEQSDIVFMNLQAGTACDVTSIGCVAELTAGHIWRKHTIVVLDRSLNEDGTSKNPHNHCFPLHFADVIFDNYEDAMNYIETLIKDIDDRYPYEKPRTINVLTEKPKYGGIYGK